MICVSQTDLGRRVARRAAGGLELLVLVVDIAQPEVNELDVAEVVDEDVRGLDVAVRAADAVEVADGGDELLEELAGLGFVEAGVSGAYRSWFSM